MQDLSPRKQMWAGAGCRIAEAIRPWADSKACTFAVGKKEMKLSLWRTLTAIAFLPALLGGSLPALSAEQTVTLSVKMWCPSCPYIIKRTLAKVPGVKDVNVSYDDQVAIVRFDDDKTDVTALTQATADVGFPSEPLATN
jgi:mercuric ion binding protein